MSLESELIDLAAMQAEWATRLRGRGFDTATKDLFDSLADVMDMYSREIIDIIERNKS